MSNVKGYTPGPWKYEEPDAGGLPHLRAANGDVVATFLRAPWNSSDIPLIAAAPELYGALQEALVNIERVLRGDRKAVPFRAEWIEEARAICAKVKESNQD